MSHSQKSRPQSVTLRGFRRGRVGAFTLVEAMIAVGVLAIVTGACLTTLLFNQIAVRKAKEESIAMNFLTKYAENIKALPFASVYAGAPINWDFNGANGGPLITIGNSSATNNWVSLNTTNFQIFYPDLLWVTNRNPMLLVILTSNNVSGTLHSIEVNTRLDWDSPLFYGARQEVQVDFYRTVDVPLL